MKISIKNFKSIETLEGFELNPMTILSGCNSSGKSSFIQLLLIFKQTLEINSSKKQIFINGDYYKAKSQKDLITGKDPSKELSVTFSITKSEFGKYGEIVQKSLYDSFPDYKCNLNVVFGFISNELRIKYFNLEYITEIKPEYLTIKIGNSAIETIIETNNFSYFLTSDSSDEDGLEVKKEIQKINYSSFFPISIEESIQISNKDLVDKPIFLVKESITRLNSNSVKSYLETYFDELFYIGPLRVEPQDAYAGNSEKDWVGVKGEYTAQILETNKDKEIDFCFPNFEGDEIRFEFVKKTLLEATNIWINDVFNFGKKIFAREAGDSYCIFILNNESIETTIKHVGFGISQILPILVQGLLMNKGATLILEQPEIHLHPKIQSLLFDFVHSLILQEKNVIIETHSDHFITRLRRRVAEDESSELNKQVNLTFIDKSQDGLEFKRVKLDDLGIYDIFPADFIENPEKELLALLNAQMKKRKLKRN